MPKVYPPWAKIPDPEKERGTDRRAIDPQIRNASTRCGKTPAAKSS
jgi:hypothetical protein